MNARTGIVTTTTVLFGLLFLLLPACEEDPVVDERRVYDVFYSLNITGESTVDSVTYSFSGREAVTHNPPVDWTLHIQAGDGDVVFATAGGTVKSGQIVLFMRIEPASGGAIERSDECEESAGIPTVCTLTTGDVALK